MHGGAVEARSAGPGLGSEFIVRLPLTVPSPALPAYSLPSSETSSIPAGMRILVVDDNRDSAEMLRALLVGCGHPVHMAYDGGPARRHPARHRPAGSQWIRSVPEPQGDFLVLRHPHRGADRMGAGPGSAAQSRRRIRRTLHETNR